MTLARTEPRSESSVHQHLYHLDEWVESRLGDAQPAENPNLKLGNWTFVFRDCQTTDSNPPGEWIRVEATNLARHESTSSASSLNKLRGLEDNWNGYGSPVPNAAALENAQRVVELLHHEGRAPSRLAPSADGGVEVYLSRGTRYCSIECSNDGTIVGGVSDRQGHIQTWSSLIESSELITRIRESLDFVDG